MMRKIYDKGAYLQARVQTSHKAVPLVEIDIIKQQPSGVDASKLLNKLLRMVEKETGLAE